MPVPIFVCYGPCQPIHNLEPGTKCPDPYFCCDSEETPCHRNDWELKPEDLREVCSPEKLGFETTAELASLSEQVIAQNRAMHALELGLGMKDHDFNIFVTGQPRSGRTVMIRDYVEKLAATRRDPTGFRLCLQF